MLKAVDLDEPPMARTVLPMPPLPPPPIARPAPRGTPLWLKVIAVPTMLGGALAFTIVGGPSRVDDEFYASTIAATSGGFIALCLIAGVPALLAWLVSGRSKRVAGITFCLIGMALALYVPFAAKERVRRTAAIDESFDAMTRDVDSLLEFAEKQAHSDTIDPVPVLAPVAINPNDPFEAQINQVTRNLLAALSSEANTYQRTAIDLDLPSLYELNRLATRDDIASARDVVSLCMAARDRYEKQVHHLYDQVPAQIQQLNGTSRQKADVIAVVKMTSRGSLAEFDRMIDCDRQILLTLNEVLDFMEQRLETIEVVDGEVWFASDADLDRYNAMMDRVMSLGEEQATIRTAGRDRARKVSQELRDPARR